jgi:hypothetical protein
MRLKGATKSIDELINSIDDDNLEFKGEIDNCYEELEKIATERKIKALPIVPGAEISKMLEDWDEKNDGNVTSEQ